MFSLIKQTLILNFIYFKYSICSLFFKKYVSYVTSKKCVRERILWISRLIFFFVLLFHALSVPFKSQSMVVQCVCWCLFLITLFCILCNSLNLVLLQFIHIGFKYAMCDIISYVLWVNHFMASFIFLCQKKCWINKKK